MWNKKYYIYSPTDLKYKEVYKNTWNKYVKNYPLFLIGFLSCVMILFACSFVVHTPTENRLITEKKVLEKEFEQLSKKVEDINTQLNSLNTKDDSLYRMVLGMEPLPASIKEAGKGGSDTKRKISGIANEDWLNTIKGNIDQIQSKTKVVDYSFEEILHKASSNKEKMLHIPAIMPIYNKDLSRTGSGFGMRFHPILKIRRMHEGIDFYAKTGTKVYATAKGKIKEVRYSSTFGNLVVIDHGYGMETYYAHLSKFNVKKGQVVNRGQVIGFVGNTGLSSGSHLHYEVHLNNKEINPINYFYGDLNADQYQKIIELSEKTVYSMD